ncbi:MAG: VWA domain-containing protein [Chloroflexota bacterium]|nr:VWA domain-containing protein [Chloroflexota bacterium]
MALEAARGAELLDRIVRFGRYLRSLGMPVSLGQVMDLVRSVHDVGLAREDFRLAARATLVTRREDGPLFDKAFDLYWRPSTFDDLEDEESDQLSLPEDRSELAPEDLLPPPPGKDAGESHSRIESRRERRESSEEGEDEDARVEQVLTYSAAEVLRAKDFVLFTEEEVEQARRLMECIGWRVGERLSRRTVSAHQGQYLDPRRSLRTNLKYGEPVELARRARKTKPRQLVALCDVSGSMDRYSRLLLQFLHAIEHGANPAEVFVFSTRLTRITRQLRTRNIDQALTEVGQQVHDFSGGTRIGESLRTFNTVWSRRVLRRGAVVLIISDGWDRGDPEVLRTEMARLQRSAHRLIWLSPLLGSPTYEPLTRGIQAALPYVDDFLPVHNLDSLDSLALKLSTVSHHRPIRRQSAHLVRQTASRA